MIWNKTPETPFANNETSKFYFWRKSRFHRRRNTSNKIATVEEELDETDVNVIRNLMDLPRLMFICDKCGNLKVDGY